MLMIITMVHDLVPRSPNAFLAFPDKPMTIPLTPIRTQKSRPNACKLYKGHPPSRSQNLSFLRLKMKFSKHRLVLVAGGKASVAGVLFGV